VCAPVCVCRSVKRQGAEGEYELAAKVTHYLSAVFKNTSFTREYVLACYGSKCYMQSDGKCGVPYVSCLTGTGSLT